MFFFNPFFLEILKRVINRIRESGDGQERLLIFYYPSDDYRAWLMTVDELTFVDEIDCRDLFEDNFSAQTKSGRHLPEMCVTMETGSADCRWFRYDKWKQEMEVFDPEHLADAAAGAGVSLTRKEWYSLYLASGKYLP